MNHAVIEDKAVEDKDRLWRRWRILDMDKPVEPKAVSYADLKTLPTEVLVEKLAQMRSDSWKYITFEQIETELKARAEREAQELYAKKIEELKPR